MESSQIATGRKAKSPRAASTKGGIHYQRSCRPDVLKRMRPSCVKVWEVLFAKAHGEAIQISLRELSHLSGVSYTHVRRVLVELERVHLIRWRLGRRGRGHKSVIEVLWRSYPLTKDPPIEKLRKNPGMPLQFSGSQRGKLKNGERPSDNSPKIKNQDSFPGGKTPEASPFDGQSHKGTIRLSPKAHRWGVGEFRRRLRGTWPLKRIAHMDAVAEDGLATFAAGLDHRHVLELAEREGLGVWDDELAFLAGPDRELAMLRAAGEVRTAIVDAFAASLHQAIRAGRIQSGRELAFVVSSVLDGLDADAEELFPRFSEALAVGWRHSVYAWAGFAVRQAVDSLASQRAREEERRGERQEWASFQDSWRDLVPQAARTASRCPAQRRAQMPVLAISVHAVRGGELGEPAHGESGASFSRTGRD